MSKDHPTWDDIDPMLASAFGRGPRARDAIDEALDRATGGAAAQSPSMVATLVEAGLTEGAARAAIEDVGRGWEPGTAAYVATAGVGGCQPGAVQSMVRDRVRTILAESSATAAGALARPGTVTSASSPAVEAARRRLIIARESATSPNVFGGPPAERQRLHHASAEAYAHGAVSSVLESAVRHGKNEAQIVADLDRMASSIENSSEVGR